MLAILFPLSPIFVFLRDVWIRTQRAAVVSRRATSLATGHPYFTNEMFVLILNSKDRECALCSTYGAVQYVFLYKLQ